MHRSWPTRMEGKETFEVQNPFHQPWNAGNAAEQVCGRTLPCAREVSIILRKTCSKPPALVSILGQSTPANALLAVVVLRPQEEDVLPARLSSDNRDAQDALASPGTARAPPSRVPLSVPCLPLISPALATRRAAKRAPSAQQLLGCSPRGLWTSRYS